MMEKALEKKNIAKYKILDFLLHRESATKAELAQELKLSMPTVLSNVGDLMEKGVLTEAGEMESTGGRKARRIALRADYCFAAGVNITAHHIGMALVDLSGRVIGQERLRFPFEPDIAYGRSLAETVQKFYRELAPEEKVLGVGISLPGIVDGDKCMLVKSHALQLEHYSLKMTEQMFSLPVYFENDANAAMMAEEPKRLGNAVYLSLNHTLGGAVCIDGRLFPGQNRKAGEFGHMLFVPGGRRCYCGKAGCADAYCAASVLTENGTCSLEEFMASLGKKPEADEKWETYLENLAMLISNIRMIFDADIILGGEVGGYLGTDMEKLGEKLFRYNLFDTDVSYLKSCSYRKEASAVGVAKHFFEEFVLQQ